MNVQRRRLLQMSAIVGLMASAGLMTQAEAAAWNKAARCRYLNELVTVLDSEARQPLSALRQDRIRVEKKEARDEQFRLHC